MRTSRALLLVAAALTGWTTTLFAGQGKTTIIPCPEPKPKFDYTGIDRSLKEPKYGTEKPAYRFFACGPEGRQIVAIVADESKGTGKGVDTFYIDLDADHNIAEPGDKITLEMAGDFGKPKGRGVEPGEVVVTYKKWGKVSLPKTRLKVKDAVFDYWLTAHGGFWRVDVALKDGSWATHTRFGDDICWTTRRAKAPVFRLGGSEWSPANERFVSEKGRKVESDVGLNLKRGTNIRIDGTKPFFAGSTPLKYGRRWVAGGHKNLSAWIEFIDSPEFPQIKMPLHES